MANYLVNARRNRMSRNPVSVGDYYIMPASAKVYLPAATPAPGTAAFAARSVVAPTPVANAVNAVQSNPEIGDTTATVSLLLVEKPNPITISIANPAVLTYADHGFVEGQIIKLATTNRLPTGLVADRSYYVTQPTTNTFKLIYNTALVISSGTQAGVHSVLYQTI